MYVEYVLNLLHLGQAVDMARGFLLSRNGNFQLIIPLPRRLYEIHMAVLGSLLIQVQRQNSVIDVAALISPTQV